jgi:hypothetical protein
VYYPASESGRHAPQKAGVRPPLRIESLDKTLSHDETEIFFFLLSQVFVSSSSNKDIMNGNKQRTLELLWRIFIVCYLPK